MTFMLGYSLFSVYFPISEIPHHVQNIQIALTLCPLCLSFLLSLSQTHSCSLSPTVPLQRSSTTSPIPDRAPAAPRNTKQSCLSCKWRHCWSLGQLLPGWQWSSMRRRNFWSLFGWRSLGLPKIWPIERKQISESPVSDFYFIFFFFAAWCFKRNFQISLFFNILSAPLVWRHLPFDSVVVSDEREDLIIYNSLVVVSVMEGWIVSAQCGQIGKQVVQTIVLGLLRL